MILLANTTHKLQCLTAAVCNVNVHASWVDISSTNVVTPGATNTAQITTATTTDVVGAPAASTYRNVKEVSVYNANAGSIQLTMQHTDGTTIEPQCIVTLGTLESLHYEDAQGWYIMDQSGGVRNAPATGRYLKTTVVQTGTVTFTSGPATTTIFCRLVGGGGGGGGCTSVAAAAAGAGGGGGGGYAEKTFTVTPNTIYTVAVGAAGLGASGAVGGGGGNTTITVGATTVTAFGGAGGPVATAAATLVANSGAATGSTSTNGDVNGAGSPGEPGFTLIVATPIVLGGTGGSSAFGGGGSSRTGAGVGANGKGNGAGGGGSATGASAVQTGGNGTAGILIIDEFS